MKRIHFMAATAALYWLVLVAGPQQAKAQWVLLEDSAHVMVERGLDYMYDLNYVKADSVFTALTKIAPNHPAGYFLLALTDWWRIKPNIADDNAVKRYSKSYEDRLQKTIDISEARLKENADDIVGLFFKGAAYGYRARLKATHRPDLTSLPQWFAIFRDANEGRKMLLECQKLAPSNSDVLLGSGLFHYYADAMPQKYPILKTVSLPPGDKELGIQMLRIASQKALYARVEADYALLEIMANMERNWSEALTIAERLHTKYPNNPDFYKYYARALYYNNRHSAARDTWEDILRRVKARQPGYELSLVRQGLYYLGDIHLRTGNPTEAVKALTEAVKVNQRLDEEESGYYIASILKLGNAYDKLGKRKEAIDKYEEVLDLDEISDYHEKARKYLKEPYK